MKLVVALDMPTPEANLELAKRLVESGSTLALKVGLNTFVAAGPDFVRKLKAETPFEVALDLKLFDIPNTMASAAKQIAALGVDLFTVHATAGSLALNEIRRALRSPDYPNPPKMLAVTVLTSMDAKAAEDMYSQPLADIMPHLVEVAVEGQADGVVCSPVDLPRIDEWVATARPRSGPPPKLIKFVPGIELTPRQDDQKRKGSLADALRGGADYIVVGRPIYQSPKPGEVAVKIVQKIEAMRNLIGQLEAESKWE